MDASQGLILLRAAVRPTPAPAPRSSTAGSTRRPGCRACIPRRTIERRYREHVMATCRVIVAEADGAVAGFVAVDGEGYVAGLFVATRRGAGDRHGAGRRGQGARPEGLTLWTFVANAGARRFYAGRGLRRGGRHGRRQRRGPAGRDDDLAGAGVTARGALAAGRCAGGAGARSALWYVRRVVLNAPWAYDQAGRAGVELGFGDLVSATLSQERPRLPAPDQVAAELWKTTVEVAPTSKRSLVYHAWVTLSATLLGFAIGDPARHPAGGRDRPQPDHGRERDALGDRQPDHPDPGHRADDHRGPELGRDRRVAAQGADLDVSFLLSGRGRHGEGAAQPRPDAARPDADLEREPRRRPSGSCAGRRRRRTSSPR